MSHVEDNWDQHWTDISGQASINPGQRFRRLVVLRALGLHSAPKPVRIVDFGCGMGELAEVVTKAHPGVDYVGLDGSQAGLRAATGRVPAARFIHTDLLQTNHDAGGFAQWATHAICSEVLEHLDQPQDMLRNILPYLGPDCHLIVTVPGGPMSAFDKHIGHRRHFTPASLRALLESSGFEVERASGTGFPFFNLYRLVVVARGGKLIHDVSAPTVEQVSGVVRLGMALFGMVLRPALNLNRVGWQMVAVARKRRMQ